MEGYVGIDVSKNTLDVSLLGATGKKRRRRVANTQAGIRQLLQWLEKLGGAGRWHVCMESTSVYWEEAAEALTEAGHGVSVVNPVRIKGHAMSQMRRSKTDRLDADVIADFCREKQPALWQPPQPEQKQLRALMRHLQALKKSRVQHRNRQSTCRDELVAASIETILTAIEAEIVGTQAQIEALFEAHPALKKKQLLESIVGFGSQTATHILAEMYDLAAYDNAKAVAADVGLTPSQYESGTTVYRRPRMSRMGKGAVRAALFYPAIAAMQHNPMIRRMVVKMERRGKHKGVIRVAVMRKLMHLAYGVLKHEQPFDPNYAA